ncbi:ATP-binding protein [Flavilitoribacter nigricans]|uniref:ATP-binding protein n=1 Tax=Flavilitoribacter nigricans TaxID=70997 RepID=UPI001472733A|nr:ATP-binding protein [Flavilitoribacter nigricans]
MGNSQTLSIHPDTLTIQRRVQISDSLLFALDPAGGLDPRQIPDNAFSAIDPVTQPPRVLARQTGWFRFRIHNPAPDRDLVALFHIPDFVSYSLLWVDKKRILKSGLNRDYKERALPDRFSDYPVHIPAGETYTYTLGVKDLDTRYESERLLEVLSPDEMERMQLVEASELREQFLFYGSFFAILLYLTFFSVIQYRATSDKAYLYYSFYLLGLFLYYFRMAEQNLRLHLFFDHFASHYRDIEITVSYLIYLAYILFTREFLSINARHYPKLNRYLLAGAYAFVGLTILDLGIKMIPASSVSNYLFLLMQVLFFPFAAAFFYLLLKRYPSPLKNYILIGTGFMLLPALYILMSKFVPGEYHWLPFYRYYEPYGGGFRIYMYKFQFGVLLEIICFSLGLSYRTRMLQQKAIEDREEAQRIKKLSEAKNQFYANITHEFRTPLTVVNSIAEDLIRREHPADQNQGKLLQRNVNRSLRLIDQILELQKLEQGERPLEFLHADIIAYLGYLLEPIGHLARKKEIELTFTTSSPALEMDFAPEAIQRIVENILSNAVKFTPAGGRIQVRASKDTIAGKPFFCMAVEDNGKGIPIELQERIFDRFYQVEEDLQRSYQGSGIGLALAKKLAEICEGSVRVRSEVGAGSTFTIALPIRHAHREATAAIPSVMPTSLPDHSGGSLEELSSSQSAPATQQVLIVEDQEDVSLVLGQMLADHYQLSFAPNGKVALDLIKKNPPHLIISDIMMPVLDGLSLCHQVKTDPLTCHIPVILLTARSGHEARLEGLQQGADACLEKPFSRHELFARLEQLLLLRRQLRERYAAIITFVPATDTVGQQHDAFMRQVLEVLEKQHSDPDFGPDELARSVFISRTVLYRKISELTGLTVALFINYYRLQKGQELLLQSDLPIKDIAYQTGFNSADYFSKCYKEKFGKSPSRARKDGQ